MIDVLNRGVGGQEATTELPRFEPDVLAEEPALVIWQVGTNAVFRKKSSISMKVIAAIAMGLRSVGGALHRCRDDGFAICSRALWTGRS